MAALHGAIALEQVNQVAVRIAEDLEFDMAGVFDIALDQQRAVAECALGFTPRGIKCLREFGRLPYDPHPASAAARRSLHQHWKQHVAARRIVGWNHRNTGRCSDFPASGLQAHHADHIWRRADENHAGTFTGVGEISVLG